MLLLLLLASLALLSVVLLLGCCVLLLQAKGSMAVVGAHGVKRTAGGLAGSVVGLLGGEGQLCAGSCARKGTGVCRVWALHDFHVQDDLCGKGRHSKQGSVASLLVG